MGNFYVNHTVRASRQGVIATLRRARRTAFVSTTGDGYTVLFDRDCDRQDAGQIVALGELISREHLLSGARRPQS